VAGVSKCGVEPYDFQISVLAKEILAFEEGLWSVELVSWLVDFFILQVRNLIEYLNV
jgi:hypothetical protein